MREIIYNKDNLDENDINRVVIRMKAIIENSNGEILLCHSNNNYHLPGGHLDEGETFEECLVREIKEETGIDIPEEKRNPFLKIIYMNKDYPNEGTNTKSIVNYYVIKEEITPDYNSTKLTEEEKMHDFKLIYINKNEILQELEKSLEKCTRKAVLYDTIEAVKEYLKNHKNVV